MTLPASLVPAIRHLAALLATAGLCCAVPAAGATQGSIGANSTGRITLSASVPARARIGNLSDIALTNVSPTANVVANQFPCVWSNTATRRYRITARGNGASFAFTLANGTRRVPYTVQWAASATATTFTSLTRNVQSGLFTASSLTSGCTAGNDASLRVTITAANLQAMVGTLVYQGTLTLIVVPQ